MINAAEARRRVKVSLIREAEIDTKMGEVFEYLDHYVELKVLEFKIIKKILKPEHAVRLRELGYGVISYGDYYQILW